MDAFRQSAFCLMVWRAFLTALSATVLMVCFSFKLGVAFLIGANVALLFAFILILQAGTLDDERVVRTEPWRVLEPHERPAGAAGRHCARQMLEETLLRFAKAASVAAIALSGSALVIPAG